MAWKARQDLFTCELFFWVNFSFLWENNIFSDSDFRFLNNSAILFWYSIYLLFKDFHNSSGLNFFKKTSFLSTLDFLLFYFFFFFFFTVTSGSTTFIPQDSWSVLTISPRRSSVSYIQSFSLFTWCKMIRFWIQIFISKILKIFNYSTKDIYSRAFLLFPSLLSLTKKNSIIYIYICEDDSQLLLQTNFYFS